MKAVHQRFFEEETDELLRRISPTTCTIRQRKNIIDRLESVAKESCPSIKLFGTGSTFLRTYLPEGDIDLVAMPVGSSSSFDGELSLFSNLFSGFLKLTDKPEVVGTDTSVIVKNIEFINARARLLRCTSDSGLEVDITVNRGGALNTVAFLEEADQMIGRNHLFKRSVLLIKAWCLHEAANYCGKSILGSKTGMLNSYALSVLTLYLFNRFTENLLHPFSVLRSFLYIFSGFRWDSFVMTLEGPIPIQTGNLKLALPEKVKKAANRFNVLVAKYTVATSGTINSSPQSFPIRSCNILDPMDSSNNLGISLSAKNISSVEKSISSALEHLNKVFDEFSLKNSSRLDAHGVRGDFLKDFFKSCHQLYFRDGDVVRTTCFDGDVCMSWKEECDRAWQDQNVVITTSTSSCNAASFNMQEDKQLDASVANKTEQCEDVKLSALAVLEVPSSSSSSSSCADIVSAQSAFSVSEHIDCVFSILHFQISLRQSSAENVAVITGALVAKHFAALKLGSNLLAEWLTQPGALDQMISEIDPNFLKEKSRVPPENGPSLDSTSTPIKSTTKVNKRLASNSKSPQKLLATSTCSAHQAKPVECRSSSSVLSTSANVLEDNKRNVKKTHLQILVIIAVVLFSVGVSCYTSSGILSYLPDSARDESCQQSHYHDQQDTNSFEAQELVAVESELWVRHGNSVSIRGSERGISLSPMQCMQMISAFSRNTSFCGNAYAASGSGALRNKRGEEPVFYQWFKDGKALLGKEYQLLSVDKIGFAEEGQYQCLRLNLTATSAALQSIAVVNIRLSEAPSAKSKNSYSYISKNTELSLIVPYVTGLPEPEYQWLKNGFTIAGATSRKYIVKSANKTHEGTYSCKLRNIAGEFMWTESTIVVQ